MAGLPSKIYSHSNVVLPKTEFFIKGGDSFMAIQNHFITAGRLCLVNQMTNQDRADPLFLIIPMDRDILNMTGTAPIVNEFLLDD